MFRRLLVLCLLGIALDAAAAVPRISFSRTLPPLRDLGGERIALVWAAGDRETVEPFVETLVDRTNRSGLLRVDAADNRQLFVGRRPDHRTMHRLRRQLPADVYLALSRLDCDLREHEGEGSTYNADGERVKRHHFWVDAVCRATMETLDPQTGEARSSFELHGEGTSPRVTELTKEERTIALQQASHYAAVAVANAVVPREVRESIALDDTVPEFDRAMALIDAGRLIAARRLLETVMRKRGASAALHFDIAAICEASGDPAAARQHYETARDLSPHDPRYSQELRSFLRRSAAP